MIGQQILVSIVVPCFNEHKTIVEVISRIRLNKLPCKYEIVVIDDCSTDGTLQLVERMSSENVIDKYVVHEKNLGKGAAIRTGIKNSSGAIVLIQDADLEYSPSEYRKLLQPILEGSADVVYGSRFLSPDMQINSPKHRALANLFLTSLSNLFTGLNLTDMETCYKVFRKDIFDFSQLRENRFGFEPEFTALVARHKLRIIELPISYYPRTRMEGKKIGVKDGLRAIWVIVTRAYVKH